MSGPAPTSPELHRADLRQDPIEQFRTWFAQAVEAGVPEPEAMCVATVDDGMPDARMVLLKQVDSDGFVFFTNNASAKGRQLAGNPAVALVWRWEKLDRQVRVRGLTEPVSSEQSDQYFASRAVRSQLGAWASAQSEVLAGRRDLEDSFATIEQRFAGDRVPRPAWWGGQRVAPSTVEFWQGRSNRLHDRFRYSRPGGDPDRAWVLERLAP